MSDAGNTAAETATTSTETTTTTETTSADDLSKELEKWKAQSRKNEERAKANANAAKELEEFRRQSMTEAEKAVAEARATGLAEGIAQGASRLVDAEIRGAAKGRIADVEALLEGLDRKAFLTAEGEADRDAIAKWIDRIAPAPKEPDPADLFAQPIDLGQGPRGTSAPAALGSDALTESLRKLVGG